MTVPLLAPAPTWTLEVKGLPRAAGVAHCDVTMTSQPFRHTSFKANARIRAAKKNRGSQAGFVSPVRGEGDWGIRKLSFYQINYHQEEIMNYSLDQKV